MSRRLDGWRRDAAALGLALLALLAWDHSGADLLLSTWAGGADAFPLRHGHSWATRLHELGRWLSGLALAALLIDAAWPHAPWRRGSTARPASVRRWRIAGVTLATMALVPALKRASTTSCPWDLAQFGGTVPYVPHSLWSVVDGGPGHCFPSGHAVAAFAFLVPALAWRRDHPAAAAAVARAVWLAGITFGAIQTLRGAHYASHVMWSAWLCAAIAVLADAPGAGTPSDASLVPLQPAQPRRLR